MNFGFVPNMDLRNNEDLYSAPETERKMSIERCIQSLVHACRCRDEDCSLSSCHKMKRIIEHTVVCTRKIQGNCHKCNRLLFLCYYHSKDCSKESNECLFPFCSITKQKFKEHEEHLQWRLKQLSSITPDQRRHATELLFETICSSTDFVVLDQMASYAEEAENDMYAYKADSPTDYYRLLAALKWEIEMDHVEWLRAARELSERRITAHW